MKNNPAPGTMLAAFLHHKFMLKKDDDNDVHESSWSEESTWLAPIWKQYKYIVLYFSVNSQNLKLLPTKSRAAEFYVFLESKKSTPSLLDWRKCSRECCKNGWYGDRTWGVKRTVRKQ